MLTYRFAYGMVGIHNKGETEMWILIIAILGENPTIEQVEFRSKELCDDATKTILEVGTEAPHGSFMACVQAGY